MAGSMGSGARQFWGQTSALLIPCTVILSHFLPEVHGISQPQPNGRRMDGPLCTTPNSYVEVPNSQCGPLGGHESGWDPCDRNLPL